MSSLNSTSGEGAKAGERTRLYPAGAGDSAVADYSNGRATGAPPAISDIESQISVDPVEGAPDRIEDTDIRKSAVFGALDGVLTSFAIVAGAAGGGLGVKTVLIVGFASIVADGLSMGLGEYLSSKAMNEYLDIERKRKEWELTHHRQGEVENLVESYTRKGMSREDAQEISARLAKYDDCFVDAMMTKELGLPSYAEPLEEGASIREGLVTFASFALFGVIPLLVYAMSPFISSLMGGPVSQGTLFLWSCLLTATTLFAIGMVKASFVSRSWFGSGMETLVLGGCCAGLAYEIGAVVAICVQGIE